MNQKFSHIITIANSIIGVGILAMPYCFKQCGIVLSIFILMASNTVSRLSCHLLLKSAIMARRKTFENLAFHAFGPLGKFIIEIGIVGFLLGTCIAFFVVMGDLGPAIVAKISGTHSTDTIRTSLLMALALFCVLPLGLLRNVDSLTSVSTASVGFYFCLVLKVITEASPHIFSGDWMSKVVFWKPDGILQCLPIFTMALFCQTQIFEIYQAIPNASLDKMNELIRAAVNICTWVYICVGTFGYIAFCSQPFTGNILMSFTPSATTDAMAVGFVLSLAFSFPLIIFPCRASLYSMLYKPVYVSHESTRNYIPEGRFKLLTFIIVFISLVTGVLIPNIELVLGLVGSTIGIMICVVFPATCFICISSKNTNERIAAQGMLFLGILVMVLGTYANLYAIEQTTVGEVINDLKEPEILKIVKDDTILRNNAIDIPSVKPPDIIAKVEDVKIDKKIVKEISSPAPVLPLKEIRQEPPQPVEPEEGPKNEPHQVQILEKGPKISLERGNLSSDSPKQNINDGKPTDSIIKNEVGILQQNNGIKKIEVVEMNKASEKRDEIDSDALKKEDKELLEKDNEQKDEKRKLELLKAIEKQQQVQKKLLETEKELLGEIKQQSIKEDKKNKEEIKKAVKEIEKIAKKAIESLSIGDVNEKTDTNLKNEVNNEIDSENKKNNMKDSSHLNENSNNIRDQNIINTVEEIQKVKEKIMLIEKNISLNSIRNEIKFETKNHNDSQIKMVNDKNKDEIKLNSFEESEKNKISSHNSSLKSINDKDDGNKIVPMPLVNPKIYKNGDNKGYLPLLNKTNLAEVHQMKIDNSEKLGKINEANLLDVLKGSNIIKTEENKLVKSNMEETKDVVETKQNEGSNLQRSKREAEDEFCDKDAEVLSEFVTQKSKNDALFEPTKKVNDRVETSTLYRVEKEEVIIKQLPTNNVDSSNFIVTNFLKENLNIDRALKKR